MTTFREYYLTEQKIKRGRGKFSSGASVKNAISNLKTKFAMDKARDIKAYLSSNKNPFFKGNNLRLIYLEKRTTNYKGEEVSLELLKEEEERDLIRDFFRKDDVGFFSLIFSVLLVLRNFKYLKTEEEKKVLFPYLPDSFFGNREEEIKEEEEEEEEETPTFKSRSKANTSTIRKICQEIEDGMFKYKEDDEKEVVNKFPAIVYVMTTYFDENNKESKLSSYINNIIGVPLSERVAVPYFIESAPKSGKFRNFKSHYKDEEDREKMEQEERERKEKEKSGGEEKEEPKEKTSFEKEKYDKPQSPKNDESDFDDDDDEEIKTMPRVKISMPDDAKKILAMSNYHGKNLEDVKNEFTALDALMDKAQNGDILKAFMSGDSVDINFPGFKGDNLNLFNYSIKQADEDLSEVFTDFTKDKWKKRKREIRDVKIAGSKLVGNLYTSAKTKKGLDKLGERVGVNDLEEGIKDQGIFKGVKDRSTFRGVKKIGAGKFEAIDKEILNIKKLVYNIRDAEDKNVLKADIKKVIDTAKKRVISSATNIIYYYSQANEKYRKNLAKKIQTINDNYSRIRKYDEDETVTSLSYGLNRIKGNFSSMVSRLNTLLDNYREIIGTATYKVKRLERDQKEYMANKKDYQVLKRRARDKYLDEKGKRDEAELKREDKKSQREDIKDIKTVLKEIESYIAKIEAEDKDLASSKEFKSLKAIKKIFDEKQNNENINKLVKAYREIRFGREKGEDDFKKSGKTEKEMLKSVRAIVEQEGTRGAITVSIVHSKENFSEEESIKLANFVMNNKGLYEAFSLSIKDLRTSYEKFRKTASASEGFKSVALRMNRISRLVERAIERMSQTKTEEPFKKDDSGKKKAKKEQENTSTKTEKEEEQSEEKTFDGAKKTVSKANKRAGIIKRTIDKIVKHMEAKASESAKYMSDLMRGVPPHAKKPEEQQPEEGKDKMASLYFREDTEGITQKNDKISEASRNIFLPYRKESDNIVMLTNRMGNSNNVDDIYKASLEIVKIIKSPESPKALLPNYANKIINNTEMALSKLEEELEKRDGDQFIKIVDSGQAINTILWWVNSASIFFRNKFVNALDNLTYSKMEPKTRIIEPENEMPKDAKPAITTKKIGDEENGDGVEDIEDDDEEKDEPKNLLDLARKKIKAGK
jgi:hypothetical protein